MPIVLAVLIAGWWLARPQARPPDTEIFLAPLSIAAGVAAVGAPVNITSTPGYDNQPSFTPDGQAILFTSARGGGTAMSSDPARPPQTDIYRYDIAGGTTTRVTATPESEYSPTVTPGGAHISVIRVEGDGTQRLWRFTLDGREPALVLRDVKPVGYHAWAGAETLALFVLGKPSTLQMADTRTGVAVAAARDIARSVLRMPNGRISFVQREPQAGSDAVSLSIVEIDPATKAITRLVGAVPGAVEADVAWTPDGALLMAHKDVLYVWRRGQKEWASGTDLSQRGLQSVTRLAVSPTGDRIAIVARQRH